MEFKDVVLGNGITARVAGVMLGCPVIRTKVKLPPVGSYLHDTVATRGLLSKLGLPIDPKPITHQVYMDRRCWAWPGPPQALANHFRKTRRREPQEVPTYDAAKRHTVETSLISLRDLWDHLHPTIHPARSVRIVSDGLVVDGERVPVSGRIVVADAPEHAGIQRPYAYRNPVLVSRTFWTAQYELNGPDFVYVADLDTPVFRIQQVDAFTVAVEQTFVPALGEVPSMREEADLLKTLYTLNRFRRFTPDADTVTYLGFSDGIDLELPPNLWALGRAATGKSVSLHHVIEDLSHAIAQEEPLSL